jgi:hypothetical protein
VPAPLPPAQVAAWAETAPPTAGPIGRLDDLNWKARREAKLLEASSRPVRLVLLGDSITANYELKGPEPLRGYSGVWQRYYADRYALNLGFSGDGTRHLLWRIMHGEIDSIAPKVAVILIGTNDIGWLHRTAADTVAGIDAGWQNCTSVCRLQKSCWWVYCRATAARGCGRPRPRSIPPWRLTTVTARCPTWLIGMSHRRFSGTASWIPHRSATLNKSRRNRLYTLLRKDRNGWLLLLSRH